LYKHVGLRHDRSTEDENTTATSTTTMRHDDRSVRKDIETNLAERPNAAQLEKSEQQKHHISMKDSNKFEQEHQFPMVADGKSSSRWKPFQKDSPDGILLQSIITSGSIDNIGPSIVWRLYPQFQVYEPISFRMKVIRLRKKSLSDTNNCSNPLSTATVSDDER
jgi:hypothetical protein